MASALHIYANLLWRNNCLEARTKKSAALRLLQEPHYRLQLDELYKILTSSHSSSNAIDIAPARLAEIVSGNHCFAYIEDTGSVILDATNLMAAGKDCLKTHVDKVWDASSPLSWARNQLAWYIVSRQHIDMRPPDLFLAPVDDAESFLAAAWTSRMDFWDFHDQPYSSLSQLLDSETCLELTPDRFIRLNFNKLLLQSQTHQQQGHQQLSPELQQLPQTTQQLLVNNQQPPGAHAAAAAGAAATITESGKGGIGNKDGCGMRDRAASAAALPVPPSASSQRAVLSALARGPSGLRNGHLDVGSGHATFSGHLDHPYNDTEDDGDGVEGYDGDEYHGHMRNGDAPLTSAPAGVRHPNDDGSAAASALNRLSPLPLRPDLLIQYIRVVFNSSGSPNDQLMAAVALALVESGRQAGPTRAGRMARAPPMLPSGGSSGGADAHRFRLPLSRLAAHVVEAVPHLLPGGASGGNGGSQAGVLMQRLRERHSRGCFLIFVPGACGGVGAGGECSEESEEPIAVLDLEAFRERVVEALAAAATQVFSGGRAVDDIRRAAAIHLASCTRLVAGRAHCVRLTTLARALSGVLALEVFDPTRLSGLERIVGAESSNYVMHVFSRQLGPTGPSGVARGHIGEEMGTFVTLNLGKLLSAAGVKEIGGLAAVVTRGHRSSCGAPEAAQTMAAKAGTSWFAAPASSSGSLSGRDRDPQPHAPPLEKQPPAAGAQGRSGGGGSSLPPPSDTALRRAVDTLFPVSDSGRVGGYSAAAAAARRTVALCLVRALHSQPGGFLPISRLSDIVFSAVPEAPDLQQLLAADPKLFEVQEAWHGGPRSVRLSASSVMSRAAGAASATTANEGSRSPNPAAVAAVHDSLPIRPNAPKCPYYMRHGTCGYGAACNYNHPPLAARPPRAKPAAPVAATATAAGNPAPTSFPANLEVKIITTACTQDHVDMLQHCFAAPQVAVACKVRHAAYSTHPLSRFSVEVGQVCLVQLYAPEVAATTESSGGAASNATHGSGTNSSSTRATAALAPGSGVTATIAARWPATVYLVDTAAGEDRKGMLLPSLSPLLEDPAVPKVVYCSSEVVPHMPRISPLHDVSVLYALISRGPHAVLGSASGATEAATSGVVPPLITLLQQHNLVSATGGAAATVAPNTSSLWAARPLAAELQQQAVLEVFQLASLWTSLMSRLATLPQQLSQAAADRLLMEHSVHSAAGAVNSATSPLVAARAAARGHVAMGAPAGQNMVASPAVAPRVIRRGATSLKRLDS